MIGEVVRIVCALVVGWNLRALWVWWQWGNSRPLTGFGYVNTVLRRWAQLAAFKPAQHPTGLLLPRGVDVQTASFAELVAALDQGSVFFGEETRVRAVVGGEHDASV